MKKIILFILCFVATVMANAQYKVSSVDKQDAANITLHQVLETENSVLVYGTFSAPEDGHNNYYINRKIKVEKNHVDYMVLNSVNFPLWNEAEPRFVHTTKKGDKVNFVLEFEKFDLTGDFNIVEDDTKHSANMLNFFGIHLEKIDAKDAIDTERFLNDGHVIYGYYKTDGHTYAYYIKDGLMLMFNNSWNGKDFIINLEITNESDHGVMFDLSKVLTSGTNSKGKQVKVVRYTPDSYDSYIEDNRRYEARQQTGGELSSRTESLLFRERIHTDNELAKLGYVALEQINRQAQENRIQKYLQEHPNNNPKALRTNSIKPGESIVGFIPFQVKKCKNVKIFITMDDYEFLISYNI